MADPTPPVDPTPPADPAATPSPPADPAKGATPPADPPADPAKAPKWGDSWRQDMAGNVAETASADEKEAHSKLLKKLERYNSPADVAKALRAAEVKLSEPRTNGRPKDATPEQLTAWRKEAGIPEAPDKYELQLDKGQVIGDDDKPFIDAFLKEMHEADATPAQVSKATKWYLKSREDQLQAMADQDIADSESVQDELIGEWGTQDYRRNVEGVKALLQSGGKEVAEALANARQGGKGIMNNPAVVRWLAGLARENGHVGATVIAQHGDPGKGIDARIQEIEGKMHDEKGKLSATYLNDLKLQEEYAQLLNARNRRAK